MNVHIVTCGTSLFGNKDFQARLGVKVSDDPLTAVASDLGLTSLDATSRHGIESWWAGPEMVRSRNGLHLAWPDDALMSAELTSLGAKPYPWHTGEPVVFLASDTRDGVGLAAAALVADMFGRANGLNPVQLFATPAEFGSERELPEVSVVRQPSLDATRHRNFGDGMNSVALTLRELFGAEIHQWTVHLSGGFKAAIPVMINVLQFVAVRQIVKVQICFEPSEENQLNAIEIPLFSFEADVLNEIRQPQLSRFKEVLLDARGRPSAVAEAVEVILSAPRLEPEDRRR